MSLLSNCSHMQDSLPVHLPERVLPHRTFSPAPSCTRCFPGLLLKLFLEFPLIVFMGIPFTLLLCFISISGISGPALILGNMLSLVEPICVSLCSQSSKFQEIYWRKYLWVKIGRALGGDGTVVRWQDMCNFEGRRERRKGGRKKEGEGKREGENEGKLGKSC